MISSGKSTPTGVHVARKIAGKGGLAQYVKFIVVAVVVVVIVVIVLASTGKKSSKRVARQRKLSGATLNDLRAATRTRTQRSRDDKVRTATRERIRREKREERRRLREERRKARLERRRSRRRTSLGSSTVKSSGTPILSAVVSQPNGEWVAVVGNW